MKRSTVARQIARIEERLKENEFDDDVEREELEYKLEALEEQFEDMDDDPEDTEAERRQDAYDLWKDEY